VDRRLDLEWHRHGLALRVPRLLAHPSHRQQRLVERGDRRDRVPLRYRRLDQATGGTPTASTTLGGFPVTNAFNNDGGTTFWVATASTGNVQYHFTAPVQVQEIQITSRGDGFTTDAPKNFVIEYSDDGSSWATAWTVTNSTGWTAGRARTFSDPLAHTGPGSVGPTLDLMFDVEYPSGSPRDGQVLTWNNAITQWEPMDPTGGTGGGATRLGQLADVEDGTGTPSQGAFLRYIDGVWQADPFQVPSIPRTLGELNDVEQGTGTPGQGAFLRYIDGVWQADPFQVPSIPRTLGELNDVEQGTGTPGKAPSCATSTASGRPIRSRSRSFRESSANSPMSRMEPARPTRAPSCAGSTASGRPTRSPFRPIRRVSATSSTSRMAPARRARAPSCATSTVCGRRTRSRSRSSRARSAN
jgi:hypothetical protein